MIWFQVSGVNSAVEKPKTLASASALWIWKLKLLAISVLIQNEISVAAERSSVAKVGKAVENQPSAPASASRAVFAAKLPPPSGTSLTAVTVEPSLTAAGVTVTPSTGFGPSKSAIMSSSARPSLATSMITERHKAKRSDRTPTMTNINRFFIGLIELYTHLLPRLQKPATLI